MSQMPAGWYADPMSTGSSVLRYWDGTRWTQHVQAAPEANADPEPTAPYAAPGTAPAGPESGSAPPAPGPPAPGPPTPRPASYPFGTDPHAGPPPGQYGGPYGGQQPGHYPGQYGGQYGYGQQLPPAYPGGPYGSAPPAPWLDTRATTPDGQPLAGWWARFGAWLLDGIITGLISLLVAFPWVQKIGEAYVDFFREALDAAEQGTPAPDSAALVAELGPSLIGVSLISLGLTLVYQAAFLRWRGATPGKMALGLKVRLREAPGRLSWGTIGARLVGQHGASLLTFVPLLGWLASFYPMVDGLWPVWDSKRQALHDKLARTNVVKVR